MAASSVEAAFGAIALRMGLGSLEQPLVDHMLVHFEREAAFLLTFIC